MFLIGAIGGAFYLVRSPSKTSTDDSPVSTTDASGSGTPGNTLKPTDLRAALKQLQDLASGKVRNATWGLSVSSTKIGSNESSKRWMYWDPRYEASEWGRETVKGENQTHRVKRQVGQIINYELPGGIYQARDENRTTVMFPRGFDLLLPWNAANLSLTAVGVEVVQGKAATHFSGAYAGEPLGFWVYHDTRRIAKIARTTQTDSMEYSVHWGMEVNVTVGLSSKRASFSIEVNETKTVEPSPADPNVIEDVIRGVVTTTHTEEIKLNEGKLILLKGDDPDPSVADGDEQTSQHASLYLEEEHRGRLGYNLTYQDVDENGLVSAGDTYEARLQENFKGSFVRFWDEWANDYAGGPRHTLDATQANSSNSSQSSSPTPTSGSPSSSSTAG